MRCSNRGCYKYRDKKKELGEGGVWYMDRKRGWGEGAAGMGVVFKITFIQEKSFNFLT